MLHGRMRSAVLGVIMIACSIVLNGCKAPIEPAAGAAAIQPNPVITTVYDVIYKDQPLPTTTEIWGAIILGNTTTLDQKVSICQGLTAQFQDVKKQPSGTFRVAYFFDSRLSTTPSLDRTCDKNTGLPANYDSARGAAVRALLLNYGAKASDLPTAYSALLIVFDPTRKVASYITIPMSATTDDIGAFVAAFSVSILQSDLTADADKALAPGGVARATVSANGVAKSSGASKGFWESIWQDIISPALGTLAQAGVQVVVAFFKAKLGVT